MSLAKLTSLSTQTLSLLLDHQRLKTLPSFSSASPSNTPEFGGSSLLRITRNLEQLRSGILALEAKDGRSEAVKLLRNQYERMRGMLGGEGNVESLDEEVSFPPTSVTPPTPPAKDTEPVYSRYTDDPEAAYDEPGIMLQTQQRMMNEQDDHLDRLSHSINRQRDISLQINDELDVHTGLLEELDTELDQTHSRLGSARRRLDRFAKGAKNNSSTVMIALLILVLLILIIVFKT